MDIWNMCRFKRDNGALCCSPLGDHCPLHGVAGLREAARDRVIAAARKLKAARDERHARVRRLQELAAEAHRTGRPGTVPDMPLAFDIGDVTEEICAALAELDALP